MNRRSVISGLLAFPGAQCAPREDITSSIPLISISGTIREKQKDANSTIIIVSIQNNGGQPAVIFDPDSYFGWQSISFEFQYGTGGVSRVVRRSNLDWTATPVRLISIKPHQSIELQINLEDRNWHWPMHLGDDNYESLIVEYSFCKTTESRSNDVYSGYAKSTALKLGMPLSKLFPNRFG